MSKFNFRSCWLVLLPITATILSLIAFVSASDDKQWPPHMLNQFLLPLTFPDSAWANDDFGLHDAVHDKELISKFRPRIYIAPGGLVPIDFYNDYLPNTVVKNSEATIVNASPDRFDLKIIERNYGYYLDYHGKHLISDSVNLEEHRTTLYGRVYREQMPAPKTAGDVPPKRYVILKYNAVFSASGLPAKLAWHKKIGASIAGDIKVWHELDIHGAIHILINAETLKPEILLLAQHNHFRSYVFGVDLQWPPNNRISICYAIHSNEPYPCPEGSEVKSYRTVGSPRNFAYVITGERHWWDGSEDLVYGKQAGALEVGYNLDYLPSKDPLYVSWIPLGDKLKILGIFSTFYRRGPPGMDVNTFIALKKYTDMAKFWYFKEGDVEAARLVKKSFADYKNVDIQPLLQYHGERLWQALGTQKSGFSNK